MSWLAGQHWGWLLLAAVLGSALTAFLTLRKASVQREVVRTESAGREDAPAAGVPAYDASAHEASAVAPSADGSLATSAVTYDDPDATLLRSNVSGFDAGSPTATEAGWAPEEPAPETIRRSDLGSFDSEATFAADDPPPVASDTPDSSSHDGELATEAGWAPIESEADPSWGDGTAETGADTVFDDADLEDTDGDASEASAGAAVTGAVVSGGAPAGGAHAAGAHAAGAHAARPEEPVDLASTVTESSFGPGSALPLAGGAAPGEAFTIKGNADSMKYHTAQSPYFGRTIAEVWFDSEDAARGAGFHRWDEKKAATLVDVPEGAFGPGSADPLEGGASPSEAFTIKGNADSMKYHTPQSPYFGRTIAEVWFDSEDAARGAGFHRWDEKKAQVAAVATIPDGAFGPGSADPKEDGSAPSEAFTIKGNADSMLFHGPDSPYYGRTKAEVWFTDADTARKAGFTGWNEN